MNSSTHSFLFLLSILLSLHCLVKGEDNKSQEIPQLKSGTSSSISTSSTSLETFPTYILGYDRYLQYLYYVEHISVFAYFKIFTKHSLEFQAMYFGCNAAARAARSTLRFNTLLDCLKDKHRQFNEQHWKGNSYYTPLLDHLIRLERYDARTYCQYEWIDKPFYDQDYDERIHHDHHQHRRRQQQQQQKHPSQSTQHQYVFHFQLQQSKCDYDSFFPSHQMMFHKLREGGGSLFSIISKGNLLKTCMVYDQFNSYYDIYCNIELEIQELLVKQQQEKQPTESVEKKTSDARNEKAMSVNVCINITVYLDYEFYNAFQEGFHFMKSHKLAFPLREKLLDEKEYCRSIMIDRAGTVPLTRESADVNSLLRNLLYDGYYSSSYYEYLTTQSKLSTRNQKIMSNVFQYSYGYWSNVKPLSSSSYQQIKMIDTAVINRSTERFDGEYVWKAPLLASLLKTDEIGVEKALLLPSYLFHSSASSKNHEDANANSNADAIDDEEDVVYYHVGASHSRYNFDFSIFRIASLRLHTNEQTNATSFTLPSLQESYESLLSLNYTTKEQYEQLFLKRKELYWKYKGTLTNHHSDSNFQEFIYYKEILFISELNDFLNSFCHSSFVSLIDNIEEDEDLSNGKERGSGSGSGSGSGGGKKKSSSSSHQQQTVIAFQFGSWDFTFYPLPLILQMQMNLLKTISKFINSGNCLNSLTLMYVTQPPYSDICHDDGDEITPADICNNARGIFRNNYVFDVFIHQFINELQTMIAKHQAEEEREEEKEQSSSTSPSSSSSGAGGGVRGEGQGKNQSTRKKANLRFFILDLFHLILPRVGYYGESVGKNHFLCKEGSDFYGTPGGWKGLQFIEHAMSYFMMDH